MSEQLPRVAAQAICNGFELYQRSFIQVTRCARDRFETRDWHGQERDSVERLRLYKRVVDRVVGQTQELLRGQLHRKGIWAGMRAHYSDLINGRLDIDLAETFFNSVTRRIFATVGVDPGIEFVDSDFALSGGVVRTLHRTYHPQESTAVLVKRLLCDYPFCVIHEDIERMRAWPATDRCHLTQLGRPRNSTPRDAPFRVLPQQGRVPGRPHSPARRA
jgi:isocitrate dehydrogenase kinase/phosphatase